MSADVVGYSRLMGTDEVGTLATLRQHRDELIDPKISEHGGRIVKTMGDGLLLEFPSVVAAVACAMAVQSGMEERNQGIDDARAVRLRIGVHVGDVIIEGDDIFGDGVNIAARIEPLAEPGGVSLSDDAYRQVRDRLDVTWRDGGEHEAKNISRPIRVWQWPDVAGQIPTQQAPEAEPLALPDKPSIAVLPFDNMSGDPEQEFFADGMTEDLITDLSKISGLFVVARNSSFTFKGQAVDVREAARSLGVRYIVEGSVRKAGSRVRINVQLIDASSGGHMWAERYDGSVEDVFELQDDVGAKVVSALAVHLSGEEEERLRQVHTRNLEAYELFVQAKSAPYPPVAERIAAARKMFEQVIELDPEFAGGYAGVSQMISFAVAFAHGDITDAAKQAEASARKAIALDDGFALSYTSLALALQLQGRHEEAVVAADEAVVRQPNDADAHCYRGFTLGLAGQPEKGSEPIERAIRLNPQFVNSPYLNLLGGVLFLARDYAGAVQAIEDNIGRQGPAGPPVLSWLATSYHALGKPDDAARVVALLESRYPAFRLKNWNFFKLLSSPDESNRIHDLMRAAGLPE